MRRYPIIREVSNLLIPPILLFALYVQFHGDFGPGGGFQAGVIFASGVILYTLLYGLERAQEIFQPGKIRVLVALGVLLYAGVGVLCMFKGGNFLDYYALIEVSEHDAHHGHGHPGQHWGIFGVELGVGLTVGAAMITIFYSFAGRSHAQ